MRRLWDLTKNSIGGAAVLLGIASLASRLVGILRDRLLSGTFGAGADLDVYYAAFRIPDLVYALVVGGVVTAGFIPVFTRALGEHASSEEKIGERATHLADVLVSMLGVVLAGGALLGVAAAPWFVPLFTPGFDAAQMETAVLLTRLTMLSPVFLGLSSVFGGILQSKRRFFVYAFAPVLYNLGIILGTVLLAPSLGIVGPTIGVVTGAFAHCTVQLLACRGVGYRFRPAWERHEGVRQIAALTVPRVASLGAAHLNVFVVTGIASTLGAGSIAVYTLANNLQMFPTGIIGASFGVAAFPVIAELISSGKRDAFVAAVARSVKHVLFLIIPATVLMLLLRAQIVRIVLGAGRFDWADTVATADTLAFFALSLFAQALWPLLARVSFALEDARGPLYAVVAGLLVERAVAWPLVGAGMGPPGLALAMSVGSIVTAGWVWMAIRRRTGSLQEASIIRSAAVTTLAALAMAVAVQYVKTVIGTVLGTDTFLRILAQGIGAGLVGSVVFFAVAFALRSEEVQSIMALFKKRLPAAQVPPVRQEDGHISA